MTLQTPLSLCPLILGAVDGERLVFLVKSRTSAVPARVDAEARAGLMFCSCRKWEFSKKENKGCHYVDEVRKLLSCSLAQQSILGK